MFGHSLYSTRHADYVLAAFDDAGPSDQEETIASPKLHAANRNGMMCH